MGAKDIRIEPISAEAANEHVKKWHYSGKVVHNSSLHLGAFMDGVLGGVMSFGPPLDKHKVLPLVEGTKWNGMLELNRMAFSELLPKNSESRAISVAMRLIRKHYPHVGWIISFADATQCGSGTIYRASGFLLTQVKENATLRRDPKTGRVMQNMTAFTSGCEAEFRTWPKLKGYQIRYVMLLKPGLRLTVPVIPYSDLDALDFPDGVRHKLR